MDLDRCLSVKTTGLYFSERSDRSLNHFIELQQIEGSLPETKKADRQLAGRLFKDSDSY
ncbi:hypothetical protein [Buttiauxella sp. S04-F03]|uniref:hypothetical protein n=1 Tax=Buttiauxella sp. S04-F03 TaxID=2904525 RepID=UPI001E424C42|nr:hypothetical protein [Buttiauxella sp. S04-F03]MCE0811211.1 hypothetical protein [Buttiauxella sp. S04-F03]